MTATRTETDAAATCTVAMLPWGDRFEDFHDKIGISLEAFRTELTGGWLFNYVEAMQGAGLRPLLFYVSARVPSTLRFTHVPTGASVIVLPAPMIHRKLRGARDRYWPRSKLLQSTCSYVATPWRALARQLRQERCDAILCHEYDHPRFDVAVWVGALLRIPVFATFQGAKGPSSWIEVPLRRLAIRRAAGLVIAAETERQRVLGRYRLPPRRIASTPNPFDTRRWRPGNRSAARRELGIPDDVVVVEWQGRVQVTRKGLDVLLDAWARVCDEVEEQVLLVLVGTGRDDEMLRRAIRRHRHASSICWVDHYVRDRAALWDYLCAADISVLPSRHEGFAVAAVEAMACGLPLVASDAPGVADALGSPDSRAGIIVPVADPVALAGGLTRLIRDPALRTAHGRRGRQRADQHFSIEKVGNELRRFMTARGAFRT